jgi:hypothetical protein
MGNFIALNVSHLRLDDLGGVATETITVVKPNNDALSEVGVAQLAALETSTTTFMPLLNRDRASARTPFIDEYDKQRDAIIDEIKRTAKTASKSSTSATALAGGKLMTILKPMWNIGREHFATQTSQIRLLLQRFDAETAALTTLGLTAVVNSLRMLNENLDFLYAKRLNEMNTAFAGPSASDASKAVIVAYDGLCSAVEGALAVLPTATLQLVFDDMNDIRRKYIARLPKHLTKALTSTAPVPDQVYTGRHLTPIPRVFYKDGDTLEELVFAQDFYVTYDNNVEVGEAGLHIHGKGRYTGTYTTTFHIVEKEV